MFLIKANKSFLEELIFNQAVKLPYRLILKATIFPFKNHTHTKEPLANKAENVNSKVKSPNLQILLLSR